MFRLHCLVNDIVKGKTIPLYILISSVGLLLFSGCKRQNQDRYSSPPGYNLERPTIIKLPPYLDEISGIAFYPKDKSIMAINDEKGWLYKIFTTGNMPIQKWKYTKGSDFEDLVLHDSTFYVLESGGRIGSFSFVNKDSVHFTEHKLPVPGKNEFEILYHDEKANQLVMLCKDCEVDDKNSLTSWGYDLGAQQFKVEPYYVIDVRKIEALMNEKKVKFKPSAAAIHPLTGDLFIISSINKVMVVADRTGNPKALYRLNPALYKQPEGMTFTPDGHLLISNESADIGAANILLFKYNKAK